MKPSSDWSSLREWDERAHGASAVNEDHLVATDVPDPALCAALADYPFIVRSTHQMWGTRELDAFFNRVVQDSRDSARFDMEMLEASAVHAVSQLMRVNRLVMIKKSQKGRADMPSAWAGLYEARPVPKPFKLKSV
jgi:hypothetical protein